MPNPRIRELRSRVDQLTGRQKKIMEDLAGVKGTLSGAQEDHENLTRAQVIVQKVAQSTQKELEYHVSELGTLALDAVFPEPYKLHVDFVLRRNRTEADVSFSRGKTRIDPMTASGCGAVDIAAFGLRLSLWTLENPRSRNVVIFDEPFRFLSRDLQPRAGQLLKELSKRLKLQMIIVTHDDALIDAADRVFQVTQKKRVSRVEVLK